MEGVKIILNLLRAHLLPRMAQIDIDPVGNLTRHMSGGREREREYIKVSRIARAHFVCYHSRVATGAVIAQPQQLTFSPPHMCDAFTATSNTHHLN